MKLSKHNTHRPGNFNAFFDDMFVRDMFHGVPAASCAPAQRGFSTNIGESDTAYHIELLAPGFSKEHFNIELNDSTMTVSAKREKPEEGKDTLKYTRREFGNRALKRGFSLPENIDKESIKARYKNGVLTVTLSKLKETVAPKRHIEVG